jgi:hypothetical protein
MKYAVNTKLQSEALVLANGPSLAKLNFKNLAELKTREKMDVFVVNFALVNDGIPPVLVDFLVLSDEGTMPISTLPEAISLWKVIDLNRQIKVITPDSWHFRFPELQCANGACLHFNDNSLEGIRKNINPLKARGYSSMTAYKALAIADYFGYKKKFILGFDNTWFLGLTVDSKNIMSQKSIHFKSQYFSDQDVSYQYKNGVLDYFYEVFHAFKSLHENFKGSGFINLDQNSLVDTFPKILESDPEFSIVDSKNPIYPDFHSQ